ncbi:hypothetical protein PD280_20380 [Virgibacillus salarius]|nr:hypothetical protein [Virgibacillus salarius]WBX79947.1 hypothetical protein PD280_20380 [Virgibacillus salarius]
MSNRYSLPLGTFHKYDTVGIKETEDKQLFIYITDTGELIAKHTIPEGKGQLVKDRSHSRDRTKGIHSFMDTVAKRFEEVDSAYNYLNIIRQNYPRYIRDQLQIISKQTKENNGAILSAALKECVKRNLYSATDFSDIVSYIKRQRQADDTITDNARAVSSINKISGWLMDTEAQKRTVNAYTEILEGESN